MKENGQGGRQLLLAVFAPDGLRSLYGYAPLERIVIALLMVLQPRENNCEAPMNCSHLPFWLEEHEVIRRT